MTSRPTSSIGTQALAACTAVLLGCGVRADVEQGDPAPGTLQAGTVTTLKGAYWLRLDDNYNDVDSRRVSWNLETPGFGGYEAAGVAALFTSYQIRTLVRIGDGNPARPTAADRAALSSPTFSCGQLTTWMTALDNEAASVDATIASASGAIAGFLFGNEPNAQTEWNLGGAAYARAYKCYMDHWKLGPKSSFPLLVSGPGGCGLGLPINCTAFYDGLFTADLGTRVDGFGIHAYGAATFVTGGDLQGFQDQVNRINTRRNGAPIYITEFNLGTGPVAGGGSDYFNQRYSQVAAYNQSHAGQIRALIYFVDAIASKRRGSCETSTTDRWYPLSLCNPTSRSWWRTATVGATQPPPPSTCDNNIPVGGTACSATDRAAQFVCARPGLPSGQQWDRVLCAAGQTCSGTRCQAPPPTTCDNNIPVGGTACNPAEPGAQFVCARPGQPSGQQWDRVLCPSGQACAGNRCQASALRCDNNIPIGGTACNPSQPAVQFVCARPGQPSSQQWDAQSCPAGHSCVGTHCN